MQRDHRHLPGRDPQRAEDGRDRQAAQALRFHRGDAAKAEAPCRVIQRAQEPGSAVGQGAVEIQDQQARGHGGRIGQSASAARAGRRPRRIASGACHLCHIQSPWLQRGEAGPRLSGVAQSRAQPCVQERPMLRRALFALPLLVATALAPAQAQNCDTRFNFHNRSRRRRATAARGVRAPAGR